MKTLAEVIDFLEKTLGKGAADTFEENFDELVYFVRSEALSNPDITDNKMKSRIRKLSEGILTAAVKSFLSENYSDDFGDVELNYNNDGVFDRNMHRIDAIEVIRKHQREIVTLLVSRTMKDYQKGKEINLTLDVRMVKNQENEPSPKDINWSPRSKPAMSEQNEIELMRLERRLPNLTKDEAGRLSELYAKIRALKPTRTK